MMKKKKKINRQHGRRQFLISSVQSKYTFKSFVIKFCSKIVTLWWGTISNYRICFFFFRMLIFGHLSWRAMCRLCVCVCDSMTFDRFDSDACVCSFAQPNCRLMRQIKFSCIIVYSTSVVSTVKMTPQSHTNYVRFSNSVESDSKHQFVIKSKTHGKKKPRANTLTGAIAEKAMAIKLMFNLLMLICKSSQILSATSKHTRPGKTNKSDSANWKKKLWSNATVRLRFHSHFIVFSMCGF